MATQTFLTKLKNLKQELATGKVHPDSIQKALQNLVNGSIAKPGKKK